MLILLGSLCNNFNDTVNVKNGCIRVTDDQRSWYDGRNQCLLTGGDLAVEEDSYVKDLRYYAFYFWTGLRKTSWRWNLNKNGLFPNYCNKNCLYKTASGDMQFHS